MARPAKRFTTRELSMRTLADFERFFWGVNGCGCALYLFGRHLSPAAGSSEKGKRFTGRDWRATELAAVSELVRKGLAHGILVYAGGEPVGWCHFGRAEEVPVPRDGSIPRSMFARDPSTQWRITCMLTRIDHRRQGVASIALAAAVAAIKKRGGGWIEAMPMAFPHRDPMLTEVRKRYGWRSTELIEYVRDAWPSMEIPGIGRVNACPVTTRSMGHTGTLSMYEKLGFKPTAIEFGNSDPNHPWHYLGHALVVRLRA
jgi:GNAT superfamily N-acetyltransferase